MIFKDKFSPRDWDLLTHLPYRMGIWMSDRDEGGGEYAYTLEMEALEREVKICQAKYANIELITDLMHDLTRSLPASGEWDTTLEDAKRAVELLKPHTDLQSLNCFKLMLVDIAEAVAKAAANGTYQSRNLYNGPQTGLFGLLAKFVRYGRGPKVTRAEKMAINQLITALDAEALVQRWDMDPYPPRSSQA